MSNKKKPARKVKGARADIFDDVAREMFTPGGPSHLNPQAGYLRHADLKHGKFVERGSGWSVEFVAELLRRRLSPLPPKRKAGK